MTKRNGTTTVSYAYAMPFSLDISGMVKDTVTAFVLRQALRHKEKFLPIEDASVLPGRVTNAMHPVIDCGSW